MNDQELLEQFRTGPKAPSQQAFSQLVTRHLDWVYSAALRQVRDQHLADDVTQTVFIVLAKKAPSLRGSKPLTAWLFKVARYASLEALRAERRRKHHENKAMAMAQIRTPAPAGAGENDQPSWEAVRPVLDDLRPSVRVERMQNGRL